jgi:hypothetical protein
MQTIPTRTALSKAWEAYAKLCQASADDPALLADSAYVAACKRAHERWSEAFTKWDGR